MKTKPLVRGAELPGFSTFSLAGALTTLSPELSMLWILSVGVTRSLATVAKGIDCISRYSFRALARIARILTALAALADSPESGHPRLELSTQMSIISDYTPRVVRALARVPLPPSNDRRPFALLFHTPETSDRTSLEKPNSGPDTELDYWRRRVQWLTSIIEQLKTKACKQVIGVLQQVRTAPSWT